MDLCTSRLWAGGVRRGSCPEAQAHAGARARDLVCLRAFCAARPRATPFRRRCRRRSWVPMAALVEAARLSSRRDCGPALPSSARLALGSSGGFLPPRLYAMGIVPHPPRAPFYPRQLTALSHPSRLRLLSPADQNCNLDNATLLLILRYRWESFPTSGIPTLGLTPTPSDGCRAQPQRQATARPRLSLWFTVPPALAPARPG